VRPQQKMNNQPVEKKKITQQFKTVGFLPVQHRHRQKIKNNQPAQKNTRKKIGFSPQQKNKNRHRRPHPYHALEKKRKKLASPGGDPCAATAKKEQSTCFVQKNKKIINLRKKTKEKNGFSWVVTPFQTPHPLPPQQ